MIHYDEDGHLGMPAPTGEHQRIIANIRNNIIHNDWRERNHITEGDDVFRNDATLREVIPDLCYWQDYDKETYECFSLLLVIEIVHTKENEKYSEANIIYVLENCDTADEGFMYNYETGVVYRYTYDHKTSTVLKEEADFSRVLQKHLRPLMKR